MFVIRREQMTAFEDVQWLRYAQHLIAGAPDAPAWRTGAGQRPVDLLLAALKQAAYHGIILDADVARYGLFVLRCGCDPANDDGALGRALRDPLLMGGPKVDALERAWSG